MFAREVALYHGYASAKAIDDVLRSGSTLTWHYTNYVKVMEIESSPLGKALR